MHIYICMSAHKSRQCGSERQSAVGTFTCHTLLYFGCVQNYIVGCVCVFSVTHYVVCARMYANIFSVSKCAHNSASTAGTSLRHTHHTLYLRSHSNAFFSRSLLPPAISVNALSMPVSCFLFQFLSALLPYFPGTWGK